MIYSIIKWASLGYATLVYSSAFGLAIIMIASTIVKVGFSPVAAANLFMLGTYPHGMNMIYSLGGMHSAHIFWLPALICIAYLLTDVRSGLFWFCVSFFSAVTLIYFERSGVTLPEFSLSPSQERVDTYSGYLLPMLIIWLGQNYAFKIRQVSLTEAIEAQRKTSDLAESSTRNAQRLSEILDEAKTTCKILSSSTTSLVLNIEGMKTNSHSIELAIEVVV